MARYGAFEPKKGGQYKVAEKEAELAETRQADVDATGGLWRTHFVYPERLWLYGVPGMFLAYVFSGMLLFAVTRPDFAKDPVYNLFGTFHTCMLLDYLPGAYAAYVFFAWQVLLQQACAVSAFLRTMLSGNVLLTLWSAAATVWMYFATSQFPLVFIFNPSRTTVLAHSIPYMIHQSAVCFFWATGISQGFEWARRRPHIVKFRQAVNYTFFAGFYLIVVIYGLTFMANILLENAGLGEARGMPAPALENSDDMFSDKFGSTKTMSRLSNCTRDEAMMDKPFPWLTAPSELVGVNRVYMLVNNTETRVKSFEWGADGHVNYTATGASFYADFSSLPPSSPWRPDASFTPDPVCDGTDPKMFSFNVYQMCRDYPSEEYHLRDSNPHQHAHADLSRTTLPLRLKFVCPGRRGFQSH